MNYDYTYNLSINDSDNWKLEINSGRIDEEKFKQKFAERSIKNFFLQVS